MNAGELGTRIVIERPVTRDVPGKAGKVTEWQEVTKAWAAVDARPGQEIFTAGQLTPEAQQVFTIRAQRTLSLDTSMRVVQTVDGAGRFSFAIVQVRPAKERGILHLATKAGVRADS